MQLAANIMQDISDSDGEDDGAGLGEDLAAYAELDYFCQAANTVAALNSGKAAGNGNLGKKQAGKKGVAAAGAQDTEEFIGLANPEDFKEDEQNTIGEVERLREENKRLKKTLLEKFEAEV